MPPMTPLAALSFDVFEVIVRAVVLLVLYRVLFASSNVLLCTFLYGLAVALYDLLFSEKGVTLHVVLAGALSAVVFTLLLRLRHPGATWAVGVVELAVAFV